jgi:RNA polymerase sigma-70 factor (ECF subfamily)
VRDLRHIKKIRNGDIEAFEELFHQYYPGMCSYAESLVLNAEVAEEVVQDVFFNIWKNRAELKILVGWQSYLYRAVFNNSMMHLRRSKRVSSLDEKWAENHLISEEHAEEEMDAGKLNTAILLTLNSLPERTQEIFNLSRFEGMKYKEIASLLSISVKTVEANMGKALKALRTSVEEFRKTA